MKHNSCYFNCYVLGVLFRISVVFRVRSAQRVKISDTDLIKRLILIVFVFAAYLTARTIAGPPRVVEGEFLIFVSHIEDLTRMVISYEIYEQAFGEFHKIYIK